ncbi:MAG: class I SAM-dependent methyltransferase [Planctomycetaceae bacterium]|nr:class I SAM-dependent methyltransferase [Planctomycetaceae bacterium]
MLATCLGMQKRRSTVISVDANVPSPIGQGWVAGVRQQTIDQFHKVTSVSVEVLESLSVDAARLCRSRGLVFDWAFIDADHNYAECRADIEVWSALIRRGGIIAGHDYWPVDAGVMDAVHEVLHG